MIPTLRTLTRKSKLKFGKYRDLTVQKILDMKMPMVLISPYFKLTAINFTDDILDELRITDEYRIPKPSADTNEYYRFLKEQGSGRRVRGAGADKLKKFTRLPSKIELRNKNQKK